MRDHERLPNENDSEARRRRDSSAGATREGRPEGVFVVRDGMATFRPVKVGIAGDEYFEVLDGLREGETIVAGTYQAIRDLKDGARVQRSRTTKNEDGRPKS